MVVEGFYLSSDTCHLWYSTGKIYGIVDNMEGILELHVYIDLFLKWDEKLQIKVNPDKNERCILDVPVELRHTP